MPGQVLLVAQVCLTRLTWLPWLTQGTCTAEDTFFSTRQLPAPEVNGAW